ncbi:MAG: type III pantothenate kinase [Planctomycetes bacterium]|nr:type III pantothenate kinase [Planctomycetota bacterium]
MSFLAIDIGNTTIHLGFFEDEGNLIRLPSVLSSLQADFAPVALKTRGIDVRNVVVASVNPPMSDVVEMWARNVYEDAEIRFLENGDVPIANLADRPHEVGIDRLLGAAAFYRKCKKQCIVVDFGTAVTFDVVSAKGEFLGGAISAGIALTISALHSKTAMLPFLEQTAKPARAIGRNTKEAIQSGLYFGFKGLISSMLEAIEAELPEKSAVCFTGGSLDYLAAEFPEAALEPNLTLEGIRLTFEEI